MFLTYHMSSAALSSGDILTPTLNLSPASQSRTHKQTGLAIDRLINGQQRTRPYERHITFKDVEQLG